MKNIILLLLGLLIFSQFAQALTKKEQVYMRLLNSDKLQEVKLGAKALNNDLPTEPLLWNFAAFKLWQLANSEQKTHKEYEDTSSWLTKALGNSKQRAYYSVLTDFGKKEQSKKIKRYVKKALKKLKKLPKTAQFDVQSYQPQLSNLIKETPQKIATNEMFSQIGRGSTLTHALKELGSPDFVGQYIRYVRRPFIGRQVFQNLRIAYSDIGSMEFKYADSQWILAEKHAQGKVVLAGVDSGSQGLLAKLVSNDPVQIRSASKEAIAMQLSDQKALDVVAQYIWNNKKTTDNQLIDGLAWLCKVLGASENGRYREFLLGLTPEVTNRKIAKYAQGAADKLVESSTPFKPNNA